MSEKQLPKINIIYEDNHLLVVEKPVNILMQEDATEDIDMLTILKDYLKHKYNKPGNVYLGLVHRLDRPVGGVCVFAKTSKAASRLSKQFQGHSIEKYYLSIVENNLKPEGTLIDYLVKDGSTNTVTTTTKDKGKKAILHYKSLVTTDNKNLILVKLETGRSHQIRVQFASRNNPLLYDQRYNKNTNKGQIALWSTRLVFDHPTTNERLVFNSIPPFINPWSLFDKETYKHISKQSIN